MPPVWSAEARGLLRRHIAVHCWRRKDGSEATPEEMEQLARSVEASGPPPEDDPATLLLVRKMARAARRWVDDLETAAYSGKEPP